MGNIELYCTDIHGGWMFFSFFFFFDEAILGAFIFFAFSTVEYLRTTLAGLFFSFSFSLTPYRCIYW